MYTSLDPSKPQIRLLKVDLRDESNSVSYRIDIVDLSDSPDFTALSYVWGNPASKKTILLDGEPKSVTESLAAALQHAPSHWRSYHADKNAESFWLWADAICINQDDVRERNEQVKLMSLIYNKAELVIGWLGDVNRPILLALETFVLIAEAAEDLSEDDFYSLDWMGEHRSLFVENFGLDVLETYPKNERWYSLTVLFDLPYWSRAWIFQETAFARDLLLCTETLNIRYAHLHTVQEKLRTLTKLIQKGLIPCPGFLANSSVWNFLGTNFFDWPTILKISAARLRASRCLSETPEIVDPQEGWITSIMGRHLQATDPKDHLYGLLSLTKLDLEVEYSKEKSVGDLYCEYVEKMLKSFAKEGGAIEPHPLFFLHYGGIGIFENALSLASWVPNFPEESEKGITGRTPDGNADQGVFPEGCRTAAVEQPNLVVAAVKIDSITLAERVPAVDTWEDGSMIRYIEKIAAKTSGYNVGVPVLQQIVDMVRLDMATEIDESIIAYAFHLLEFLISTDPENMNQHFETLGIEALEFENDGAAFNRSFMKAFFPSYTGPLRPWRDEFLSPKPSRPEVRQSVIYDLTLLQKRWRFFETAGGYLGLGPLYMQAGDEVFVLNGSGLPIVLREQGGHFVHVGTSFIPGLMSGETAGLVVSGKAVIREVTIR